VGGTNVCVGVGGVAEGVLSAGGVGGDGVSLAPGVTEGGVGLGPVAEGEGDGKTRVEVRDGVTLGGTVTEGTGRVEEAMGDGRVAEGGTRVAVGGMTPPSGTKSGWPTRKV